MGDSPLILTWVGSSVRSGRLYAALADATQLILEDGRPKILAIHAAEATSITSSRRSGPTKQIFRRAFFNSIINKTAISYKANRKIGGSAPSEYLLKLQQHKAVQLDDQGMDAILRSNFIDPQFLRADDFAGFFHARRATLLGLIEKSMGKESISSGDGGSENGFDVEDDEDEAEVVVGQS